MAIITIDNSAGVCQGVNKAIDIAEYLLTGAAKVYSLGELVHCTAEVTRLEKKGLTLIEINEINSITNSNIIIRSHGVTPDTHFKLAMSNNTIHDATCYLVRQLQNKIKISSTQMQKVGGQVIIFGRMNHPEIDGLLGFSNSPTYVLQDTKELSEIDFGKPTCVFAQTTSNEHDYHNFITELIENIKEKGFSGESLQIYNTICNNIKKRIPALTQFAKDHETIIFVAGKQSSNGQYLFSVCESENSKSYSITSKDELNADWFKESTTIGVTGAASTPLWLLEEVADAINELLLS